MVPPLLLTVSPLVWHLGPALVLGLAAVYALLPRAKPYPPWWGGSAGGAALLLGGFSLIETGGFSPESVLFYAFAGLAIVSGVLLITQSNPARAALAFALVVLSSCGLFLLQAAPFLMAATIIIYAGAIIVTFLFVLMLAQQHGRSDADLRSREPFLATVAGFALLGALLYVLTLTFDPRVTLPRPDKDDKSPDAEHIRTTERLFGGWSLTDLIELAQNAAAKQSSEEIRQTLKDDEDAYFKALLSALGNLRGGKEVQDLHLHVDLNLREKWHEAKTAQLVPAMQKVLEEIVAVGQKARTQAGRLTPTEGRQLSTFSGPPPNKVITLEKHGNAPLPADNTAFLGRALFSDYLLAVELGGTLLLVATIGAIAIASRREGRRS